MSMQLIREHYRVAAKRGARVLFQGAPGRITSADRESMHLRLRLDSGQLAKVHPTWQMQYLDDEAVSRG